MTLRTKPTRAVVKAVAVSALEKGATVHAAMTVEHDFAPRCESPMPLELFARPDPVRGESGFTWVPGKQGPLRVLAHVKCRHCGTCLNERRRLWAARAIAECKMAHRNWLVTLTMSPSWQLRCLQLARHRARRQGWDFETAKPDEQFHARVRFAWAEITRWLKRVRKESKAELRYILVVEAHKSGDPHFHLLVHEVVGEVKKRTLQSQWQWGFSNCELVKNERQAGYACKYLGKSLLARVRASKRYGSERPTRPSDITNKPVQCESHGLNPTPLPSLLPVTTPEEGISGEG